MRRCFRRNDGGFLLVLSRRCELEGESFKVFCLRDGWKDGVVETLAVILDETDGALGIY